MEKSPKMYQLLKMILLNSFIIGIFSERTEDPCLKSEIKVMVSNRKPFVVYDGENEIFSGLEVAIVENFSRKMNKQIEFIKSDVDLQNIFGSANAIRNFFNQSIHS